VSEQFLNGTSAQCSVQCRPCNVQWSVLCAYFRYGTVLTEQERRMIAEHRFSDLTQYQRRLDAEIDAQVCFCSYLFLSHLLGMSEEERIELMLL